MGIPDTTGRPVTASQTAVDPPAACTERTLWYQAGVFVLTFVLMLALLTGRRYLTGLRPVQVSEEIQHEEEADGRTETAGNHRRQAR
jgi:hypothetical protein